MYQVRLVTLVAIFMAAILWNSSECFSELQALHDTVYKQLLDNAANGKLASFPFCPKGIFNDSNKSSYGHSDNNHSNKGLRTDEEYFQYLRSINQSALNVDFDIGLYQIVEVNERQRVIVLKLYVAMSWIDCRLIWSLSQYPIEQLRISNTYFKKLDLFIPHITILEELEYVAPTESEFFVEIWNHYIAFSKKYTTTVSCNIDVSMYPLDTQSCNLTFESVLDHTMVSLTPGEQLYCGDCASDKQKMLDNVHMMMGRYIPNDAWEVRILGGYHAMKNNCLEYEDGQMSYCTLTDMITHTLLLRRNPTYQLINLMLPAFLIVLISGCVFLLPPGSSDKMSLSITSLLSLFIFTQIMYNKMPETGETLPLLSQYFLSSVAIVSLSCLASSVSIIFEKSSGSTKLPSINSLLKGTSDHLLGGLLRFNTKSRSTPNNQSKVVEIVEIRQLAKTFDRVFFVFHIFTSLTVLTVYMIRGYIPWRNYGYRAPQGQPFLDSVQ